MRHARRTTVGRAPTDPVPEEPTMCRPVECPVCHKTTWEGCGEHVDQVKASVPPEQWCDGLH